MQITNEWLKGFFDGDGCLSVNHRTVGGGYALILTNTNKELIDAIAEYLTSQGFFFSIRAQKAKSANYSTAYHITIANLEYIYKWFREIGSNHPKKLAKWAELQECVQHKDARQPLFKKSRLKAEAIRKQFQQPLPEVGRTIFTPSPDDEVNSKSGKSSPALT